MKTVLEIWADFIKGGISINEADKLMKATIQEDEKQEVKHIAGRYNQPYHVCFNNADGEFKTYVMNDSDLFKSNRRLGIACESSEEAGEVFRQQNAYLTLIDKIFELNDGWFPDWEDGSQPKHCFAYNHNDGELDSDCVHYYQSLKNELYFKYEVYGLAVKSLGAKLINLAIAGIK